jgi:hypothetical protein
MFEAVQGKPCGGPSPSSKDDGTSNIVSRIKFTRYTISERSDKHWLVAGLRLPLLWEHDGPETVVSIDIHDDISKFYFFLFFLFFLFLLYIA